MPFSKGYPEIPMFFPHEVLSLNFWSPSLSNNYYEIESNRKESRATLTWLYRTSGRFYMLHIIFVDSTSSYWKGSRADVD